MSTILIALLIIGTVALIIFLLVLISKRSEKKRQHEIFMKLSDAGSRLGLSFTSQEILGENILALDGLNRKLVLLEPAGDDYTTSVLALEEVKACKLKTDHINMMHADNKQGRTELFLNSILLQFEFKENRSPFEVKFYDANVHSIYQLPDLRVKAADWDVMISKLIFKQASLRA